MTAAMFESIAAQFAKRGLPAVHLEEVMTAISYEGIADPWGYSPVSLANGLRAHGLVIRNGMVERDGEPADNYNPVMTDFAEFKTAAQRVINEAEYPVDTMDLATRTGLATTAIPYASMKFHLGQIGIHFIPGLGYWRSPQYTDPTGRIISRRFRSERVTALMEAFEVQGWPLAGKDLERQTKGVVTSRYVSRYAAGVGRSAIVGLGRGLFCPADKATQKPVPMSPNVATAILSLTPDDMIDDMDHLRLFQIAAILERRELATIKRSRSSRVGKRTQTMRVTLTDAGRKAIEKIAKRGRDEF